LRKDFGDGIKMQCDENASAGDGGDAKKTAAIEECGVHKASCGDGCDSGGRKHLYRKYCKPILQFSVFYPALAGAACMVV
jgi:hypothetical protein